ncbi:IclR family transcriptional regulator [Paeniglutamicibacter kerguelensis]|uniref:DNA-binding IclR family transcriptional regulator n=1 Tax=Paeniglutamicibacter kerguelensis TaxID=254788 RepID=A0ABS4XHV7_9MICC|nr:DNA-binding IclR family transcriptional regulator [Paeniglutamicibacter kerguelensis]
MANSSAGRSSLSRAIQLLAAFDVDALFLTVSQLAARSGLSLTTTHRLLGELVETGLLERQPDKSYRLGVRLWELAAKTPGAVGLREIARPHLNAVHARVRQHTQLAVRDGHEVIFLDRVSFPQAVVNYTLIGGRLPLHASSSGLVLLAHAPTEFQEEMIDSDLFAYTPETVHMPSALRGLLQNVRRDGHAVGNGYIHADARGIAVPIRGVNQDVIAALSVVVPNDETAVAPVVTLLAAASRAISRDLLAAYTDDGEGTFRVLVRSSERSMAALPSIPKITPEPTGVHHKSS